MLMLGNLFRESGVVKQLTETASNALMYIVVILLGTSVGASTSAEAFLKMDTLKIVALGMIAFAFGTAGGVLLGKLLCKVMKDPELSAQLKLHGRKLARQLQISNILQILHQTLYF